MGGFLSYLINSDEELAKGDKKPDATPVTPVEKDKVHFPVGYKQVTFPSETHLPTAETFPTQFPTATTPVFQPVMPANNQFLDKINEAYENAFTKLNQNGYDFYEIFKAICKSGIDNPMVYELAIEMAQSMGANTDKTLLVSQADYYINELNKTHDSITADGQAKSTDLINKKNIEANTLTTDLSSLRHQLQQIQLQISENETALTQIDQKYQPDINNIGLKLSANDIARDTIINKIKKVKINIQNNLK